MSDYLNAFDEGRNYGWNEMIERVRALRFENLDNPVITEILTNLLTGLLEDNKN